MRRHPDWLKVKIGSGENFVKMKHLLRNSKLHTICEEAKCPNISECFGSGTAVFLILGDICTRNCKYCNVTCGKPLPLNENEPKEVAESIKKLGLKYVGYGKWINKEGKVGFWTKADALTLFDDFEIWDLKK